MPVLPSARRSATAARAILAKISLRPAQRDLLSTTALVGLTLMALLAMATAPVHAAGGSGGAGASGAGSGGAGGADDNARGTGGAGAAGTADPSGGGGGGGGGAGGVLFGGSGSPRGGPGGAGSGGAAGGAASPNPFASAGNGAAGAAPGDGGGGGGGGYTNGAMPGAVTSGASFTAPGGGQGGAGNDTGGGGGGGAGGTNMAFMNAETYTLVGGIVRSGGQGGAGGASASGFGGAGGTGGAGAIFDAGGTANIENASTLAGGAGGAGGIGGAGNGANGAGGAGIIGRNVTINNSGTISGGLNGDGVTRANAITFTGGTNVINFGAATSNLVGNVAVTSNVQMNAAAGGTTVSNAITGSGGLIQNSSNTLTLTGANTYSGGTVISAGTLSFATDSHLGAANGALTFNGGTLRYSGNGGQFLSAARTVTLNATGTIEVSDASPFATLAVGSSIGGAGGLITTGPGTVSLTGNNSYGGTTTINQGMLSVSNGNAIPDGSAVFVAAGATLGLAGSETIGSLAGAGNVLSPIAGGNVTLTTGSDNTSTTLSGTISNGAGLNLHVWLTKIGAGTFTLSGLNTYTGNTTVNAGTLAVNGSIASSALTTVNAGATLGGNGTVGNTSINGGTLSPGSSIGTLTIQGNLVLTAASTYLVEVDPASSDRTNVTGTATLGDATVRANYAPGSYISRRYTIVNAAGGVNGTFNSLVNTNLPATLMASLSYDANNAYLDLALDPTKNAPAFAGLNGNQSNVATALVNSFNAAGGIPLAFATLTPQGLTQVSGEAATGTQQTTFNAMDQFINLMTDPFMGTRAGGTPQAGAAGYADETESLGYASTRKGRNAAEREAYAKLAVKAPPRPLPFEQRWSVWGAGYGGTQSTDGNATVGSNDTTSRIYGGAAGFDYRLTPETLIGFSLGGAGTKYNLANGLGGGSSEMFQAGIYGRHHFGAAYIAGALAYGWQDVTTDRTVFLNSLRANFDANAVSGRIEAGYRFATGMGGITPYAAGQFTTFWLPAYEEQVVTGTNLFALSYASKDVTASRSELGLRADTSFAMQDAIVTLRGRAAWAHNSDTDRSVSAIFQTLPASAFAVNGASPAREAALVSVSAETKWRNGFSVAASFEGEFSGVTESYAGKGVLRYQW